MRGMYANKRILDKGELTQLMIIIAGLAVAAVVAIGAIASVMLNKGEAAAGCISDSSAFKSGHATKVRCKDYNETAKEKSKVVIGGSFSNPTASGNVIGEQYSKEETAMRKDLQNVHERVEGFRKENGHYPTNGDMVSLNYQVDLNNYPSEEYNWNFEYCRSFDEKDFIITVYAGNDEVIYVSSNNKNPVKYTAEKDKLHKFVRNGEWTGGYISPCYSGTSYSAADRAGLSKIGSINKENNLVISGGGRSGLAHKQGVGFVYPTGE